MARAQSATPAGTATLSAPAPDEVVAAERAFAADAIRLGRNAAFLAYIADEAIALRPEPEPAKPRLLQNAKAQGGPALKWWPIWAGVARSNDLGFTSGPYVSGENEGFGYYFTIWKRQADGSWKWIYDSGPPSPDASPSGPDTPVAVASFAAANPSDADPVAAVAGIERRLAERLQAGDVAAYRDVLATDVRVMGVVPHPAIGRDAALAALAQRPTPIRLDPRGGGASAARDLVYSYGVATWTANGQESKGSYMRLWRWTGSGWELLLDQMLPSRRPQ